MTRTYGKDVLTFNAGQSYNDGRFYVGYESNIIITRENFKYYGYQHNYSNGTTAHFLVQDK